MERLMARRSKADYNHHRSTQNANYQLNTHRPTMPISHLMYLVYGIGHVNNDKIPMTKYFTGISRNTQSKLYML